MTLSAERKVGSAETPTLLHYNIKSGSEKIVSKKVDAYNSQTQDADYKSDQHSTKERNYYLNTKTAEETLKC